MLSTMRRSLVAAAVLAAGLFTFAGAAEAASFDQVEAWWNSLDCPEMNAAMNAYDSTIMASGMDSGFCAMYAELGNLETPMVNMAADEITGDYDSIQMWWEALDCRQMSIATGTNDNSYCGHFANAPKATETNVLDAMQEAGVAEFGYVLATGMTATAAEIMMSDLWVPFMATPAIPLIGVGVLGLLLAGRGAWLRRRRAL